MAEKGDHEEIEIEQIQKMSKEICFRNQKYPKKKRCSRPDSWWIQQLFKEFSKIY